MRLIQVTLGAGATQISSNSGIYCSILIIQNNAAAVVRIGDNTVSATKGIALASGSPGGSSTVQPIIVRGTHLQDWWLFGTAAQVIDILYESAN